MYVLKKGQEKGQVRHTPHNTHTKFACILSGGGYDFPGSNSGVDLFSLTGWIPERIFFPAEPQRVRDFETPAERAWERLYSASSFGDCLITVSTSSDISEAKAEEIGLVTGHAYAVLSVIQAKNGTRLLQLKNPWAHKVSMIQHILSGTCT